MDATDTYATITVVCLFLAVMLYEVGMFCTATVLCAIGITCVVLAYHRCGTRRSKRKRR